jgi:hypothetical protein
VTAGFCLLLLIPNAAVYSPRDAFHEFASHAGGEVAGCFRARWLFYFRFINSLFSSGRLGGVMPLNELHHNRRRGSSTFTRASRFSCHPQGLGRFNPVMHPVRITHPHRRRRLRNACARWFRFA